MCGFVDVAAVVVVSVVIWWFPQRFGLLAGRGSDKKLEVANFVL